MGHISGVIGIGRAVRPELTRQIGLGEFARERLRREQGFLRHAGQRLGRIENALDPSLVGQVLAAAKEHCACRRKPARNEASPVKFPLPAHGLSPAGSIT